MRETIAHYDAIYGQCEGCGKSFSTIVKEDGSKTVDDIVKIASCFESTVYGAYYCHIDCFRDTRG